MLKKRLKIKAVIFSSFVSGLISSFVGVLVLSILTASTGEGFEQFTPISLTLTCIFSSIVAGSFYYGLSAYFNQYKIMYTVLSFIMGLLSVLPALLTYEGYGSFSLFVISLHLSVSASITIVIPLISDMVVSNQK